MKETSEQTLKNRFDPPTEEWRFKYDGDDVRVTEEYLLNGTSIHHRYFYAGGSYEVHDEVVKTHKTYYAIGGMTVAMYDSIEDELTYMASDHLTSASIIMDDTGELLSEQRYMPFGEVRLDVGSTITETDLGYTGQRAYGDFGLMDYHARFYSPKLGRFVQPDSIIPSLGNSQAWDRYQYGLNNPVKYTDPSGHVTQPSLCDIPGNCEEDGNAEESWTIEKMIEYEKENQYGLPVTPGLTDTGRNAEKVFRALIKEQGWWNADGDFTLKDFIAFGLRMEFSTAPDRMWGLMIEAAINKIRFLANHHGWTDPTAAVLNYMGTRMAAINAYDFTNHTLTVNPDDNYYPDLKDWADIQKDPETANIIPSLDEIKNFELDNNKAYHWGNLSMFEADGQAKCLAEHLHIGEPYGSGPTTFVIMSANHMSELEEYKIYGLLK